MHRNRFLAAGCAIAFTLTLTAPAFAQGGNTYLLTIAMSDGSTGQVCASFLENPPATMQIEDPTGVTVGQWARWDNNKSKKWVFVLGDDEWAAIGKMAKNKIKKGNLVMWTDDGFMTATFRGELDPDCDPANPGS